MEKYFSNIIQLNLGTDAVKRAWGFARHVVPTTNYADSNQSKTEKIRDDHFVSKLGEEAAKLVLSGFGKVTGPDYNIYDGNKKSWADDLLVNGIGVAVKTQRRTVADKYSLSWTFQSGQLRRDTILDRPFAWVIFVEYNDTDPKNNPYNCYVYPPFQMQQLTLGEPVLSYLKESKKVVYAGSLPL